MFISVELPEEIRAEVLKIQKELDMLGLLRGKFTEIENLHLTLKFLGELSDVEVRAVKERLKGIEFEPFDLELRDLGVFSEKFVRIVWLSANGKEVFDLQERVDATLEDLFEREHRFMGHLTIARPKKVEQRKMFLEELSKIKFPKLKFKVDKINLRESKLYPEGAEYKNLLEVSCVPKKRVVSV